MKLTQTAFEGRISAIEKDLATCQASDRRHDGAIQTIFSNHNDTVVRLDRLETTPVTLPLDDLDTVTRNNARRRAYGRCYDEGSDPEQDEFNSGRTLADEIPTVFSGGFDQHDGGTAHGQRGPFSLPDDVESVVFIPMLDGARSNSVTSNNGFQHRQSFDESSVSDPHESYHSQDPEDRMPELLSDVVGGACDIDSPHLDVSRS